MRTNQELEAEIDRLGQALRMQQEYAVGFARVVRALYIHCPNWRGRADTSIGRAAVVAIENLAKFGSPLKAGGRLFPKDIL